MESISLNYNFVLDYLSEEEIFKDFEIAKKHLTDLINKTTTFSDYIGWIDYASNLQKEDLNEILEYAEELRDKIEVLVVIGIGGSYLGTRAILEMVRKNFYYLQKKENEIEVVFAGNNINEDYLHDLISVLDNYEYGVVVVSKSGTTTEPSIAFRIINHHIEQKYGVKEASKRIYCVTDKQKGLLKKLADEKGYKTFYIPHNIGGRYSVLTPVGLLPLAIAGVDIEQLIKGAIFMEKNLTQNLSNSNIAITYALIRNALYKTKNKLIEILVSYNPKMFYFLEWWKQLFGESEGKNGKGIFPASALFTTDLHSLGQLIQEGNKIFFETILNVEKSLSHLIIPYDENNIDELNYISYKKIGEINHLATLGTLIAHSSDNVPCVLINIPTLTEKYIGQLIYFFELSCAISGLLLGVNPFNQPGVEAYKNNLFALLGKPGFENKTNYLRKIIEEKLNK